MTAPTTLERHAALVFQSQADAIAGEWVEALSERLGVDERRALPSERILDHIPAVLERLGAFLREPDSQMLEAGVVEDLQLLASLRREQGFGIGELLEEFEILGDLIQRRLEAAVEDFAGDGADPVTSARLAGRLHRGLLALSTITADYYRKESAQDGQNRAELLQRYGRVLAHELRNRLGAARAAAELLGDRDLELGAEKRQRQSEVLIQSLDSVLGSIEDVQALAIAQSGQATFEEQHVALESLVRDALVAMEGTARNRGVELEVGELTDITVNGPRMQIVLANLVGNAIKYCDGEKDRCWVRVSARRGGDGDEVEIRVEDNGIGIPADMQDRIFDEYERIEEREGGESGRGLGLSIVRTTVHQMGGSVRVESEPGAGSAFIVRIPAPGAQAEEGPEGFD